MKEFKVGDIVERINSCSSGLIPGAVGVVTEVRGDWVDVRAEKSGLVGHHQAGNLVLRASAAATLDTLRENDILIDDDGDERTVLGVAGKVVFVAGWGRDGENLMLHNTHTVGFLKEDGWKVKGTEPDGITELTLEEVAKLKGVPVEKLRIKD